MSDIRSMLLETANKIMKDFCSKETILEAEKGKWPQELWDKLEETGMTLVGIPEESGGVGGDIGDALQFFKIAGKFAAPIPLADTFLANWVLSSSGLPVLNEPTTIKPIQQEDEVHFSRVPEGFVVTGKLQHVPWARDVKQLVITGKSDDGEKIVSVLPLEKYQINYGENLAGESRDEVILDNIFIPETNAAITSFDENEFRNLCTSTRISLMAGALEKVLELSIGYANERLQFGRPIGKFQAVKQQLAVMAGEVVASKIAADSTISAFDRGQVKNEVMMAKIQIGRATTIVTKIAHQVIGAMGFTDEHELHLSTRRLWSWQDEYGSENELAFILGHNVFDNGAENLWPMVTLMVPTQNVI